MAFFQGFLADQAGRGAGARDRYKDDSATAAQAARDEEQSRQFDESLAETSKHNDAYTVAQTALAGLRSAQTLKQEILNSTLPDSEKARIEGLLAKNDLVGAQTALDNAKTTYTGGALTDNTNAKTGLAKAQIKEIIQGKIPVERATADYRRHRIDFDNSIIDEKRAALSEKAQHDAQSLSTRLNIAGAGNQTRLAIAYMAQQNVERGQDLRSATQTAITEYTQGMQNYRQELKSATTNPNGAQPTPPPNINVTVPVASQPGGMSFQDFIAYQKSIGAIPGGAQQPQQNRVQPPPITSSSAQIPNEQTLKTQIAAARAARATDAEIRDHLIKANGLTPQQADRVIAATPKAKLAPPPMSGRPAIQGIDASLLPGR